MQKSTASRPCTNVPMRTIRDGSALPATCGIGRARRASAQLIPAQTARPDEVAFGSRVTLRREQPTEGRLSYRWTGRSRSRGWHAELELAARRGADWRAARGGGRNRRRPARRDRGQHRGVTQGAGATSWWTRKDRRPGGKLSTSVTRKKKMFFSEEKNQKTFSPSPARRSGAGRQDWRSHQK